MPRATHRTIAAVLAALVIVAFGCPPAPAPLPPAPATTASASASTAPPPVRFGMASPIGGPVHSPIHSPVPSSGQGPSVPATLPGLTFDLDPSKLGLSNGTAVSSAAYAGTSGLISLSTSSTGHYPVLDTTHAVNGLPALDLISSQGSELYTQTAGPTTGTSAWEAFMVVRYTTTTGANANYPSPVLVGRGTAASGAYALVGGGRGGAWWDGGFDGSNLQVVAGTLDTTLHAFSVSYAANHITARQDGVVLGTAASSLSLNLPQGFGIAEWFHGTFGAADAYLYRAIWYLAQSSNLSNAQRQQLERYLSKAYGITISDEIAVIGDSLTWAAYLDSYTGANTGNPLSGVGVDHANAFVYQLSAQPGMGSWTYSITNDGIPGAPVSAFVYTASQGQASGFRKNNLAVLWGGTNDQLHSVAASTTLANLTTVYNALLGSGYQAVVVLTVMPWTGMNASSLATLNSGILSTFPHVLDIGNDTALQVGCSVGGGVWSCTYDDSKRCGSGVAVGHLTGPSPDVPSGNGEGYVAAQLAPVLLGLKNSVSPANDNGVGVGVALVALGLVAASRRRKAA